MAVRYAMPIVGTGAYRDPVHPKYDCKGQDIHVNYVLSEGVAVVTLKGPEPEWAHEPDVTRYDEVSDVPDMEVLQYLPSGMAAPVLDDGDDETPSPLSGDEPIDPDLSGPTEGEDP